jgi:lipopolysaccharide/colanic/teichoic acid biosynthesis glycosyltransferase
MDNLALKANREKLFFFLKKEMVSSLEHEKTPFKILLESGKQVYEFFSQYIDVESNKTIVTSASTPQEISCLKHYNAIINLARVNDIRYINKFFESINGKLNNGDVFIGAYETFTNKRSRKLIGKIPLIGQLYFGFEFLFERIMPKIKGLKKIYFAITKGRNRLLSKAEVLGRLVCCGFEILDVKAMDGLTYFVARKVKQPVYDLAPSYGPFYKMPRLGKNGKMIGVYKLRTMHPYSEYLQDYVLKANGYADSGKPADDFRLTPWAHVIRKYWLDELPQLINVLKGDLKLVGVRPISQRYFQDIPADLQKLRLTQKPGCIPPYVALDRKSTVESVLQAERDYLEEKLRNPYTTDLKFFFKAIYNILFKNKRSA